MFLILATQKSREIILMMPAAEQEEELLKPIREVQITGHRSQTSLGSF